MNKVEELDNDNWLVQGNKQMRQEAGELFCWFYSETFS